MRKSDVTAWSRVPGEAKPDPHARVWLRVGLGAQSILVMCCGSLGTRPSHTEEEEGLVNLHTHKFEVRGISAE